VLVTSASASAEIRYGSRRILLQLNPVRHGVGGACIIPTLHHPFTRSFRGGEFEDDSKFLGRTLLEDKFIETLNVASPKAGKKA
jgi:hypothetical protein